MAFQHGKSGAIMFGSYDVSQYLKDVSSSQSVEPAETTGFGSTAKSYIVGLEDANISMSGMWEGSATGSDAIFSGVVGSSTNNIVTVYPAGAGTVGNRTIMVAGKLTSYEATAAVADVVTASAEIQADGGKEAGVGLTTSTALTTTLTGTAVDNAASTTNGGVAHLHITANTMNNTTIAKVQHSADNSTWADLSGATFATVSATSIANERLVVAAGTTVNRYIRAIVTFAGTGSATVYVSFARR
jgi:hypothetical protein